MNDKPFVLILTFASGYRVGLAFGPCTLLAAVQQIELWRMEGMCTYAEADAACNVVNDTITAWEMWNEEPRKVRIAE